MRVGRRWQQPPMLVAAALSMAHRVHEFHSLSDTPFEFPSQ